MASPDYYDTYPVSLEFLVALLSYQSAQWRQACSSAEGLPEYLIEDTEKLADMGIGLLLSLLGPHQDEKKVLRWDVARWRDDDPARRGRIVARQLAVDKTLIEFWRDGFPDKLAFEKMIAEVEDVVMMSRLAMAFSKDDQEHSSSPAAGRNAENEAESTGNAGKDDPLQVIPDGESRMLAQLWNDDYPVEDIIRLMGKQKRWSNKTIYNKVSNLRSSYPGLVKRRR